MIKILFLAANPTSTTRLRLDAEIRAIDTALRQTEYRGIYQIEKHFSVRVTDIQGLLLRYQPDIVHFSGHGSSTDEIIIEDQNGNIHPLSPRALSNLFSILGNRIRCVVLNACYSRSQGEAIANFVDCVIGMSTAIGDTAAISFATSFYQALGYGQDVKTAFELGRSQIDLENLGEENIPVLLTRYPEASLIKFTTTPQLDDEPSKKLGSENMINDPNDKLSRQNNDNIYTLIGDNANNVVVGKDIHIAGLRIPKWAAWLLLSVVIIGAIAMAASILPNVSAVLPTATPIPSPTATQTPSPTPLPTFTPTPIPRSPAEAALYEYLVALKAGDFVHAAEMFSDYSLKFMGETRENGVAELTSNAGLGNNLIDYQVTGVQVLEEDKTVRFQLVMQVDKSGETANEEHTTILHKDEDGKWRVNIGDLVDYRIVHSEPTTNETAGVTIKPLQVQRHENYMLIAFAITSVSGRYTWFRDSPVDCSFGTVDHSGEFVGDYAAIKLEGFYESYPTACQLPRLTDSENMNPARVLGLDSREEMQQLSELMQGWTPPEIIMAYSTATGATEALTSKETTDPLTTTYTLTSQLPSDGTTSTLIEAEVTINADSNLRQGPGTDYPIIGGAKQGERYRVIGKNLVGDWWQIDIDNNSPGDQPGWVFAQLVIPQNTGSVQIPTDIPPSPVPPTAVPTSIPAVPVAPTPIPAPNDQKNSLVGCVVTTKFGASLRSQPDMFEGVTIAELSKDREYQSTERSDTFPTWFYIVHNDQAGWVPSPYLIVGTGCVD